MLIDTHCHLDFKDFDGDRDEVIRRARNAGVEKIINVGSSIEGSRRSVDLAARYNMIYATVGVHPHDAASVSDKVIEELKALAVKGKVVAIGEVGLDFYRNLSPKDAQIEAFRKFLRLGIELGLPLVIHAREASREIMEILKKESPGGLNGVMHCFSGDLDFLRECLDMGLHISFTCNITFKNAGPLREVAGHMKVERLVLETDAPYLSPQKERGKRNEPSSVSVLAEEWARILGLSREDIARITTHNANRLFKLSIDEPERIAYEIRDSLYINITNRCTNSCDFCVRAQTSFVKGHNLRLDAEPGVNDILSAVKSPEKYKEIVFCGYGEPTLRLDVIKTVAGELKKRGVRIRVVTNGHGDIINKRPIACELKGLVDKISVSLNAENAARYDDLCKPEFGTGTYKRVLDFIGSAVSDGIETEVTCLDVPGVDLGECGKIARSLGANFRVRKYGTVG